MSRFTERRSKASPMDFEYTSEERRMSPAWTQDHDTAEPPRKRTFSDMHSSGFKPGFSSAPAANKLTQYPAFTQSPSNTPFLFHTPSTSTPPPNLFWKPPVTGTKSRAGSMTPSSPSQELADISMEGPSTTPLHSKAPQKKDSVLEDTRQAAANELEEDEAKLPLVPTRKVSTHAISRVYRERRRQRSRAAQRRKGVVEEEDEDPDEDDSEEDERLVSRQGRESITANHHYTFNMPGVPANRSEVPYMLLGYVQFLFNLSLVLVFLYIIIHGIMTVQRDVEHRIAEYRTELAEQIATCTHLYEVNKCFPLSQRVPALARQCSDWESCMQRDPTAVGRARVVAETIGEVINSFVEPISWKTLGFGLTSLGFLITLINVLFSFYRARVAPIHHPAHRVGTSQPHLPAGAAPFLGPSTPVSSRIAPSFLTPAHHYMTPTGPYPASPVPVEWGRIWSGTDMPLPGTPTRRKGRGLADGKTGLDVR